MTDVSDDPTPAPTPSEQAAADAPPTCPAPRAACEFIIIASGLVCVVAIIFYIVTAILDAAGKPR